MGNDNRAKPLIPYGRQNVDQADIDAVVKVLQSDWLTQGPIIEEFERAVAKRCQVKHAIAVSSGTAALHVAVMAARLGKFKGDMLWTSPLTFIASANVARFQGAKVDFVDIEPHTGNMSVRAFEKKIGQAHQYRIWPKVVMPVHYAGQSCEMEMIHALVKQYDNPADPITIIEDASHALGATYQGRPVGCCQYSDMAVLSFHPVKMITTGEGGMILTNRDDLNDSLRLFRSHGMTRMKDQMVGLVANYQEAEAVEITQEWKDTSPAPWYYQMVELGYNYRMNEMQAALGLSQLDRLDTFLGRRRALAVRYSQLLQGYPVNVPYQIPSGESSFHLYPIRLQLSQIKKTRRQVFEALRAAQIGVQVHYIPVHLQPYYRRLYGWKNGDFPLAEAFYNAAISIPLYYGLSRQDQDRVVSTLQTVLAD
jgi:UDP-4-amino-4,6-dideoxy-N-acetyl-beta-L-altrosamine transaminase